MGYQKTEQATDTLFDVTPEEAPPRGCLMIAAPLVFKTIGLFIVMAIGFAEWGTNFWFFLVILIPVSIAIHFAKKANFFGEKYAWLLNVLTWKLGGRQRKKESLLTKYRLPSRFSVNPEGISLNGQSYSKKDIHRVVSRNEVLELLEARSNVVTVVDGSAASRNYAAGARMGMAFNMQLAAVSYRVEFESGGVPHLLAGGLNEAGAFVAIRKDVSGILGLE
jgi:hypothetical protein